MWVQNSTETVAEEAVARLSSKVHGTDNVCLITFDTSDSKDVQTQLMNMDLVCVSDIVQSAPSESQCYVWLPPEVNMDVLAYESWVRDIKPLQHAHTVAVPATMSLPEVVVSA